ncbi:MAG: GntR family transcriptional regulator [Alphaproteobacteria bacterium]
MTPTRPPGWVAHSAVQLAANGDAAASGSRAPRLYQVACSVLRHHIEERRLPPGLILLEGRIADAFAMSRAPVRRALALLCDEGLIHRYNGRGYLVGPLSTDVVPRSGDLRDFGLALPKPLAQSIGSFTWERIYTEVETQVVNCIPFGTYRVLESGICEHYSVSRTVAREVLNRLRDRALIEKDRHSHWTAGPLTSHALTEHFEMRCLLEPAALLSVADGLDRTMLIAMRDRLAAAEADLANITPGLIDAFEEDLHVTCLQKASNQRLVTTIIQSQLPFVTNSLFRRHINVETGGSVLPEHRIIFEHLIMGAPQAAAAGLLAHLQASRSRTKARLKVLSLIPEPETTLYLERVN